jgi:hypothetical protein
MTPRTLALDEEQARGKLWTRRSLFVRCGRPDVTTETLAIRRERKPFRRRLAGHGRLGWGSDKAARPNSIDAVATLVAVSSSKPANALASLEPAEVRTPSRR